MIYKLVTLLTLIVWSSGCQSNSNPKKDSTIKSQDNNKQEYVKQYDLVRGCKVQKITCKTILAPITCQYSVYSDKGEKKETLYTWASNYCQAQNKLNDALCEKQLYGYQKVKVSCRPDSTEGSCPIKKAIDCGSQVEETECIAKAYYNQELHQKLHLKAQGKNECEAKHELNKIACEKNLNPSYLSMISCQKFQQIKNKSINKEGSQ